jgi:tungstate transport system substrate-binding protein
MVGNDLAFRFEKERFNMLKLSLIKLRTLICVLIILSIGILFTSCIKIQTIYQKKPITIATTTSLNDTDLLTYLQPIFEKETFIPLKIISQGTGQAIKTGENGDADVLFVHDKKSEEKFVADGFSEKRIEIMYNFFVIVGPPSDPAKIKTSNVDAVSAFKLISNAKSKFVSRGDDSGTNKKEKAIWASATINPIGDWYISAGKGMGDVLKMSSELSAYTLSDKSTYLSMKDNLKLDILLDNSPNMKNVYTVMPVSKEKHPNINAEGRDIFIKWLTSERILNLIKEYGKEKYGEPLFTVN